MWGGIVHRVKYQKIENNQIMKKKSAWILQSLAKKHENANFQSKCYLFKKISSDLHRSNCAVTDQFHTKDIIPIENGI